MYAFWDIVQSAWLAMKNDIIYVRISGKVRGAAIDFFSCHQYVYNMTICNYKWPSKIVFCGNYKPVMYTLCIFSTLMIFKNVIKQSSGGGLVMPMNRTHINCIFVRSLLII